MRSSKTNAIGDFLTSGNELINKAILCDNDKKYQEAFKLYMLGLEYLENARKYEKCEPKHKAISKKMEEYMERAEALGRYLKEGNTPDASGNAIKKEKDAPKDKEKDGQGSKSDVEVNIDSIVVSVSPNVRFDQITGLEETKKVLEAALVWPNKFKKFFEANNTQPMRSLLLYGPPGTGKTLLAKAVATEMKSCFITVNSTVIMSKWLGESEKIMQRIFEIARSKAPCVLFFDEVDGILSSRTDSNSSETSNKVKNVILTNMDGFDSGGKENGLFILAATNNPSSLDIAAGRRFHQRLYIPLPDQSMRKEMFKKKLELSVNELADDDYDAAANATENYSGADIETVVKYTKESALRKYSNATQFIVDEEGLYIPLDCVDSTEGLKVVEMRMGDMTQEQMKVLPINRNDLMVSITKNKPSTNVAELKKYDQYTQMFGSSGN